MSGHVQGWQPYPTDPPHTVTGHLLIQPQTQIPQLHTQRPVLVHLPPSYFISDRRYPVLYMHDGQNLFDAATSFAGTEWQVDETLQQLAGEGIETIAVGIYHGDKQRIHEYTPFARWHGKGERYLDFLVQTLKPAIDRSFRTQPDPPHTGLIGSSMGGLISLYGFFQHPQVFGLAGVISPALWVAHGAIYEFVRSAARNPGRIYLDHGTRESSARPMMQILKEKGYQFGRDLHYVAEKGGHHSEHDWARRLPDALRFLLVNHTPPASRDDRASKPTDAAN